MSKQCKIIEDLLPLYYDGVCSEESRQMVEKHLLKCEACQNLLRKIEGEVVSPAKKEDVKVLEGICKAVRKGRKKALLMGVSITLAVLLLLFLGISAGWYGYCYSYYAAFAEGQTLMPVEETVRTGKNPSKSYTWRDSTYEYHVSLPDFWDMGGHVGMSRLDNNETQEVELAISRMEPEKYMFHVFVNDAEKVRYFILDGELNLHGNYSPGEMTTKYRELDECRQQVQEIMEDALKMWPFLK